MLICWLLSSFVSVIRAMLALVASMSDSMLFTLLLMPLTLTVIMVICLFFLILFPFFLPWSVQLALVSCWDYLDVGGSEGYFLSFLVGVSVSGWRSGSDGVFVVYSGSGFVVFGLSVSGLFVSGSGLIWFLLYFFLRNSWSWSMILSRLCMSSGLLLRDWFDVCGSSPLLCRPCCVVSCVWMSFYFCCCGGVGFFVPVMSSLIMVVPVLCVVSAVSVVSPFWCCRGGLWFVFCHVVCPLVLCILCISFPVFWFFVFQLFFLVSLEKYLRDRLCEEMGTGFIGYICPSCNICMLCWISCCGCVFGISCLVGLFFSLMILLISFLALPSCSKERLSAAQVPGAFWWSHDYRH